MTDEALEKIQKEAARYCDQYAGRSNSDFQQGAGYGYELGYKEAMKKYDEQLKKEMDGIYSILIGNGQFAVNQSDFKPLQLCLS